MARLKEEVKRYIVRALACYESPSDVAASVREEFGIEIGRNRVHEYDPTSSRGEQVAAKWKELFEAERNRFENEVERIPIAHKAVRMHHLNRMVQQAMKMKNYALAASLIEQAAKEQGGMFTNRREISGPDGGPVETRTIDPSGMSDAALEEFMRARHDTSAEAN